MQDAGIVPATDDGAVAGLHVVGFEFRVNARRNFPFVAAGPCELHGSDVGGGRDLRGMTHQLDLGRPLEQAHLVERGLQCNDRVRSGAATA